MAWSAASAWRFSDIKAGDIIEAFVTEKVAADLGALTSAKA